MITDAHNGLLSGPTRGGVPLVQLAKHLFVIFPLDPGNLWKAGRALGAILSP